MPQSSQKNMAKSTARQTRKRRDSYARAVAESRTQKRKDNRVRKSSHGTYNTVADMVAAGKNRTSKRALRQK